MAKSWKSFVKPQATPADSGGPAPAPNWQELAQQNETLQQLLQERSQLEQQMQQLTGQPAADAPSDRYSNEIPSFGQRKKNDAQWQQQKEEQKQQAQQREASRREAMRAWEAKKAAQAQKTQLARKVLAPVTKPAAKPIVAASNALQQLKALKKQQTESKKRRPEKIAKTLDRAKELKKQTLSDSGLTATWEQLKALKQQKRAEQPTKRSALTTAFEKWRNKPKPMVNELRKGIKKIKERSPKENFERLKQKKAEPLKQVTKQIEQLVLARPKTQLLQKAKESLKLDEKREQVLEKLRLKKKLEAQWERGTQKVEDLMALKSDAEKKWKEFKEMEAGEKDFDNGATKKEQPSDTKAEEKRQAEKEEQRRREREEERRQQRQEQRREERRSERKKDKYS